MTAGAVTGARRIDARRAPRVRWPAFGRYVLDDRIEHQCRSIDISSAGVSLMAPTRGMLGQRVVCYLDTFGRMEGRIVRLFEGGFALELTAPAAKRAKLVHQIAWHAERVPDAAGCREAHVVPRKHRVVLELPNQRRVAVQILDLSRKGAALTCPAALAIGDAVMLGRRAARVTRVAQRLVGVEFDVSIAEDAFNEDVVL